MKQAAPRIPANATIDRETGTIAALVQLIACERDQTRSLVPMEGILI
jgi:hypothetical protein